MTNAVQLYCWHFMAYPHLPADFDEKYDTGWVTVPNSLWDTQKSRGLYQQYIDQLAYADELGFDGMVLNEHHQNIYGLMPSPNLIAAALTQKTKRGKIVILGNLLPLHLNPLRVAEEYAMLDNMSDGRLIAGFAPGSGPETFNYNVPSAADARAILGGGRFHCARLDRSPVRSRTRAGTIRCATSIPGRCRCRNRIRRSGFPARARATRWSRSPSAATATSSPRAATARRPRARARCSRRSCEEHGDRYQPSRMGILMSAYVGETDGEAQAEAKEGVWYFLKNCLKGHLRREGRQLTFGPGVPYIPPEEYQRFLQSDPTTPLLGDAESWDDLQQSASIVVGSADTVYRRIMEILEHSKVGNLLIQFHLGNMADALTRKSMRLFASEVAPRLRADSAKLFAREFPAASRTPEMAK